MFSLKFIQIFLKVSFTTKSLYDTKVISSILEATKERKKEAANEICKREGKVDKSDAMKKTIRQFA